MKKATQFIWFFVCLVTIVLVSCATTKNNESDSLITIKSNLYKDDIVITDSYKMTYSNKKNIRVVLRVPNSSSTVTTEDTKNVFFIDLEKRLVREGFIVRDRGLLEKLLTSIQGDENYSAIYEKIGTDLILQIDVLDLNLTITPKEYEKDNKKYENSDGQLKIHGAEIAARVVSVKEGEVQVFANLFAFSTEEDGTVKYKMIKNVEGGGVLGISPGRINTTFEQITPNEKYLLYDKLITKLIDVIKLN